MSENREPFEVSESDFDFLDASEVADTPADDSSPSEEVVEPQMEADADLSDTEPETADEAPETDDSDETEPEETEETEEEPEDAEDDEELVVKKKDEDGKDVVYDFRNAPKAIREQVQEVAKLKKLFVRDQVQEFRKELEELSPSSFFNFAKDIVQSSAESEPATWAEFLVKADPKLVASALMGEFAHEADSEAFKDANPKLLAELYRIYLDEESDVAANLRWELESRDADLTLEAKPKLSTPEMEELKRLREQQQAERQAKEQAEVAQVYNNVFDHVDDKFVAPIVQKLGFMPTADDTPEQKQFKTRILEYLPTLYEKELTADPATKDDWLKLQEKLRNKDEKGAMALLPSIIDKIEESTMSFLGNIKNSQTASLASNHKPAKKPPVTVAPGKASAPAPKRGRTIAESVDEMTDQELLSVMGL